MADAFISLGSNLGSRRSNCQKAIERLLASPGLFFKAASAFYETKPVEKTDQPNFINQVVWLKALCSPPELLKICLNVEKALGRTRTERFGPRNIDLDLLLMDDWVVSGSSLILPHPRMHQRRFVLEPLAEIAGQVQHPLMHKSARQLLEELGTEGGEIVRKLN